MESLDVVVEKRRFPPKVFVPKKPTLSRAKIEVRFCKVHPVSAVSRALSALNKIQGPPFISNEKLSPAAGPSVGGNGS
jgi:hypothetical protein